MSIEVRKKTIRKHLTVACSRNRRSLTTARVLGRADWKRLLSTTGPEEGKYQWAFPRQDIKSMFQLFLTVEEK
jgi:hypothetical protein